jgi:very-short-patch-repair endonuclease
MPRNPLQNGDSKLQRRRDLRQRSTKPEQLMWAALRNRRMGGLKFRRQHSIGEFIVDFVCVDQKLVVEIDGDYHDYVQEKDKRRQRYLESQGYRVMRFSNEDVLEDVESVIAVIASVSQVPPHPNPLPHRVARRADDELRK